MQLQLFRKFYFPFNCKSLIIHCFCVFELRLHFYKLLLFQAKNLVYVTIMTSRDANKYAIVEQVLVSFQFTRYVGNWRIGEL